MKSGKGEGDGYRKEKSMAAVICIFLIFVTLASLFYFAGVLDHFVDFVSSSKGKIK